MDPQGIPTQVQSVASLAPMSDQGMAKRMNPSGIVTNISGQRFAKNATSAGTTITFGRPPPNVTISSTSIPPPLTKIGAEAGHPNACVPTTVFLEGKGHVPMHTMSMAAASGIPPPPYTSSATSGHPMPGPRPLSSSIAPRQSLPTVNYSLPARPQLAPPQTINSVSASVGLPPAYAVSVGPSQMPKQNVALSQSSIVPPPPLLHTARPLDTRPGVMAVPTSNMAPALPQRSFQPRFTGPVGGKPRGPRPVPVSHPHSMNGPPPLSSSPGLDSIAGMPSVSGGLIHHVPNAGPHRTIIPNYHGVPRGVAPGMPRGNVSTSGGPVMLKAPSMVPSRYPPQVVSPRGLTVPRTTVAGQQVCVSPLVTFLVQLSKARIDESRIEFKLCLKTGPVYNHPSCITSPESPFITDGPP